MIRYKRLNESFDNDVSAMHLMRTIESSKYSRELKKIVDFKEIESLAKKVFDAIYRGSEEGGVKIIPGAKWQVDRTKHTDKYRGSTRFSYNYKLKFRGYFAGDHDDFFTFPMDAIDNIEDRLAKIVGESSLSNRITGTFSSRECDWEILF